jgi:hypothetical protein
VCVRNQISMRRLRRLLDLDPTRVNAAARH